MQTLLPIRHFQNKTGNRCFPPSRPWKRRKHEVWGLILKSGSSQFRRSLANTLTLQPGRGEPMWVVDSSLRCDEAPVSRSCAAVGGRLLRLLAVAERSQRAVEADATGCAFQELHAGGESGRMHRAQVDVRLDGSENYRSRSWSFIEITMMI